MNKRIRWTIRQIYKWVIGLKVIWDKWIKELDEQLDKSINWIYHYLES